MSDQLNDFIAAQHQTNVHLAESMSRCQTILEENSRRLFGGDGQPGVLPMLYSKIEKVDEKADVVGSRAGALESWKKTSLAWIAGAVAVLPLEGTALALYFNSVASHIKVLAGH